MLLNRLVSICICLLTVSAFGAGTDEALHEDAFHYRHTRSPFHDMLYSQMWYFNFIDDALGIAGVLGAGVLNPQQRLVPIGQTSAVVALVRNADDGPSFYLWSRHYNPKSGENFSASKTFAPSTTTEFHNPAFSIKVISADEYLVESSITEGARTVVAHLTYSRAGDGLGSPWVPWVNIQLPHFFKVIPGRATYTMPMPNARVNGTLAVIEAHGATQNHKTYVVRNARGYHDGYFGAATLIPGFQWDWLSYQQDDLAIQMIAPHGPNYRCAQAKINCLPGNLRVSVKYPAGPANFEFTKRQIKIHYDEMKVDREYPSVPYPASATITAIDDNGNTLNLKWSAINYLKVYYHPPKPMKDLPTYEIVANLKGSFTNAKLKLETPVNGTGWVDYSNNR